MSAAEEKRGNPPLDWFDSTWRLRALRRLAQLPGVAPGIGLLARVSPRWADVATDISSWLGLRKRLGKAEWRRLTASSYTALVYHRFAGELKPGQERIDIAPRRFARQLWALRLAGFRPLSGGLIASFHAGATPTLPARSVAITIDDATADCVGPLRRHAGWEPQLFVPTRELGGRAHWIDGEPVASWEQVGELAQAGVGVGSHTRHHRRLTGLDPAEREEELSGSLADLRERLPSPLELIAYPNGDHDEAVCRAAQAAGYVAAFTTEKGRNGTGTNPYRLKRVSVHGHDGALAVLWKAATGEGLPPIWLRLRRALGRG